MGLFKKLIGTNKNDVKLAKLEIKKEKLEQKRMEAEKKAAESQGKGAQALSLVNYQKACMSQTEERVCQLIKETDQLNEKVKVMESPNTKLSFKQKGELRDLKLQLESDITYLYILRDYFALANKLLSGITLTEPQYDLILQFSPFFDGINVLDDYTDVDDEESVAGEFKKVGLEFKKVFVGSKKTMKKFSFDEYIEQYSDQICDLIIPNIDSQFKLFKGNAPINNQPAEAIEVVVQESSIKCPNCQKELSPETKFCSECGAKIEKPIPVQAFCPQCGNKVNPDSKFCPSCGHKLQ